jgi:hypothetical protein
MRRPAGAACSGCARPRDSRGEDGPDLAEVDRGRSLKRDGAPPVTVIAIDELDAVGQLAGLDWQMEATLRSIRMIGSHLYMMLGYRSKS